MLFNSLHFVVFFVVVTWVYYTLGNRFRWYWLLMASCWFYMAFIPAYILILLFTIATDFFAAQLIARQTGKARLWALSISLAANLGILFAFKYYNFFAQLLAPIIQISGHQVWLLHIVLPLGLSFHTLQAMGYCIEVYYGRQKPVTNFPKLAQYVLFYPQLVAGPIERPGQLLPQLGKKHSFYAPDFSDGLRLVLWGFFKKLVIADRFALLVDSVYNHPEKATGPGVALATILFSIQIFADFSAYSDIARGAARCMGIDLVINFEQPYFAQSVSEFWRRWHISLSSWLRDYVYIPLGGNRHGKTRQWINLLIVMLLSGLWHGAGLNFLFWGLLHGLFMITEQAIAVYTGNSGNGGLQRIKGAAIPKMAFTFLPVSFAWIFFRAPDLNTGFKLAGQLLQGWNETGFTQVMEILPPEHGLMVALLLAFFIMTGWTRIYWPLEDAVSYLPKPFRWALYYSMLLIIACFGQYSERSFIYFQF